MVDEKDGLPIGEKIQWKKIAERRMESLRSEVDCCRDVVDPEPAVDGTAERNP